MPEAKPGSPETTGPHASAVKLAYFSALHLHQPAPDFFLMSGLGLGCAKTL